MNVLLATDGSANSRLAAKMLVKLKFRSPVKVHVISVAHLANQHSAAEFDYGDQLSTQLNEQSRAAVDQAAEILRVDGIAVATYIEQGHPAAKIIDKAQALGVDLVVMGAQGHSFLARALLGSVSDYVATHLTCSVLLVRDTQFVDSNRAMKICVGFDDSAGCKRALVELAQTGLSDGAQIDIVNAVPTAIDGLSEVPLPYDPLEIVKAHQSQIDKAVVDVQQTFSSSASITGHVQQCGNVGMGLADFVEEHSSDLLLVGDMGRSMIARFFLGSVSRSVLRHAGCSVWVSRSR